MVVRGRERANKTEDQVRVSVTMVDRVRTETSPDRQPRRRATVWPDRHQTKLEISLTSQHPERAARPTIESRRRQKWASATEPRLVVCAESPAACAQARASHLVDNANVPATLFEEGDGRAGTKDTATDDQERVTIGRHAAELATKGAGREGLGRSCGERRPISRASREEVRQWREEGRMSRTC